MRKYTVLYVNGSEENSEWNRLLWQGSKAEAEAKADEIIHDDEQPRPAFVFDVLEIEGCGLPEGPAPGWDYEKHSWC